MKTLMMSLKTVLLAVLLITGTQSFAQKAKATAAGEHHKGMGMSKEKREQRFAEASKKLNLTADQQTKIKAILEKNKEEMKALREANKTKTKEERRKVMVEQVKKTDAQIIGVLDAKQQAIYQQMKSDRKEEMKKKKAEHEEMQEELGDAGISVF